MNQRVSPEDNSNSPGSKGGRSSSDVHVNYIGELLTIVRQYEHQIDVLENKNKECGTQATAHLVEKVAHLEEQLNKSKDEQLRMSEQLQQAAVLDKAKPKGAAKSKKVGNGWILFMKQRSLEKDLGEKFETLEAFLEYAKDNGAGKKHKHKRNKVSLPKKGKGVGLKEFLKEMSNEYKELDKEMKTEYNDAAKKLALCEIDMGASPEIEKEIHM